MSLFVKEGKSLEISDSYDEMDTIWDVTVNN